MMGLVVEPVIEGGHQGLHELLGGRDAAIADDAGDAPVVETRDPVDDALVLRLACHAKVVEPLVQDGVETVGCVALAGEALHPDAVGGQQVIERAVHRLEEGALVGAVLGIGEVGRRLVQPPVGPGIVACEARIVLFHAGHCAAAAAGGKID